MADIPDREYDRLLYLLVKEMTTEQLLNIQTVRDCLGDILHDKIVDAWEEAQSIRNEFEALRQGEEL